MTTALPRTTRSRPAALLCCLLTLLAALDPLPFLQAVLSPPATAQGSAQVPDDDDDEMIDPGRETTAARPSRRTTRDPSPALVLTTPRRIPSASPTSAFSAPPACQRDRRNGLGAPLLC